MPDPQSLKPARHGDWMSTASGRRFWPLDPRPEEVAIEDIAHHLAQLNRWQGACREPYSVAQHSVEVANRLPDHLKLQGLLHDSPEYVIGDHIRPLKAYMVVQHRPGLGGQIKLSRLEERLLDCIGRALGLDLLPLAPEVREADWRMCATEARDLLGSEGARWAIAQHVEPYPATIEPWDWTTARLRFLTLYHELRARERAAP